MPDSFDADGLTVKNLTEIRTLLVATLKIIFGNDINVESNSPDGQQVGTYSQGGVDLREVLLKINAGFDPDQAEGVVLDQRLALNGVKRGGGTFTFQDIAVTTDRALNLVGLDSEAAEIDPDIANLYTVRDDEGNEFYLLVSQVIVGAGTASYTFRAADIGKVEVLPNTITTPVTVIPGVTAVNNPTSPNSIGENEENDFDAKIRRRSSTALPAIGYLDAIEAVLNNLDNVTVANVYENNTKVTDARGIPGNTIWAIVEGGDPDEIALAIYAKKDPGAGMKGAQQVDVTRPAGGIYPVYYDLPISENLHIQFKLTGATYTASEIKSLIVANVIWQIGKGASASTITAYVQSLNANFKIEDMEISDDGIIWVEVIASTTLQNRYINDTTRITIT